MELGLWCSKLPKYTFIHTTACLFKETIKRLLKKIHGSSWEQFNRETVFSLQRVCDSAGYKY